MVGGRRRLTMNGNTTLLGVGDIVLINPGDVHACESADGSLLDYRAFNVSVSAMNAILADLGVAPPRDNHLFLEEVLCDQGIYSMASSCHATSEYGNQDDAELLFLFMGRLYEICGGRLGVLDNQSAVDVKQQPVEEACLFIEENFRQRITLDDLAKVANMSRYALIRAFSCTKGITPYRYLTTRRIMEARGLLGAGIEPADVAAALSFSDQAHFGRVFKEITGVSPGVYRASCARGAV